MSEMAAVVEGTIKELLERLDALAAKLGVTAEHIWKFTVAAKIAEARRDLQVGFAQLLPTIILWMYSWFIYNSNLPRESGTYAKDFTFAAYALGFTGLAAFGIGIICLYCAVEQIIDGVMEFKTVEYDAFTDLLKDLRG